VVNEVLYATLLHCIFPQEVTDINVFKYVEFSNESDIVIFHSHVFILFLLQQLRKLFSFSKNSVVFIGTPYIIVFLPLEYLFPPWIKHCG